MRRMPTTNQLELIEYLSKVTKINNYADEIQVPFAYMNKTELEEQLQECISDETLDFENHVLDGGALLPRYYLTEEDAELGDTNYVSISSLDDIHFPETINTISDLAD